MKPTDRHQHLHFSSAHPNHTKRSVVFSQTLHISRLCSNESDFERNKEKMRSWFVKREYPEKLIDSEITKVKFNIRETNRKNKGKNGVPFLVTYHPLLNSLYGIIRKNLHLLNMDQRVKQVFSSQRIVFFVAPINRVAIWFERNSILWKEGWVHANVAAIVAKFAAV